LPTRPAEKGKKKSNGKHFLRDSLCDWGVRVGVPLMDTQSIRTRRL